MVWKKIEARVLPWIFALYCGLRGYALFTGAHLRGAAEAIYAGFPLLQTADRAAALFLLVCGAAWLLFFFRKRGLRAAILAMAAWELAQGVARFAITGFAPVNWASGLRLAAYLLWFFATYYMGGERHARGENPVCGDSLLQGGGGSAGDGEAAEAEDGEPASGGENIG